MTTSGIREKDSIAKRTASLIIQNEENLITSLKLWENEGTSLSSLAGGGNAKGTGKNVGNYLPIPGGEMEGQIGHEIIGIQILSGVIDVSKVSGQNSGFILLNGENNTNDELDTIIPGSDVNFSSEMFLQADDEIITIKNFTTGSTNIITPSGADVILGLGEVAHFLYSQLLSAWVFLYTSSSSGGGNLKFPIDFPEEQRGPVGGSTQAIDFTQSDRHAVIMTLTDDIGISLINTTANKLQITSIKLKQDGTGGHALTGFSQSVTNAQKIIDAVNDASGPNEFVSFIVEFEDGLFTAYLKNSNVVVGGGGGEFFGPWTNTHDAGKQQLSNLNSLGIVDSAGNQLSFLTGFSSTETRLSIPTGKKFSIHDGILSIAEYDSIGINFFKGLDMNIKPITNNTILGIVDTGGANRGSLSGDAGATAIRLSIASGEKFIISDVITDIAEFSNASGLIMSNTIRPDMASSRSLGTALLTWDALNVDTINFSLEAGTIPNAASFTKITATPLGMYLNVEDTNNLYHWSFDGLEKWVMSSSFLFGDNIAINDEIELGDSSNEPTQPGRFRRDGADVFVFSGGQSRNLSNIGGGGGGVLPSDNVVWTGNHTFEGLLFNINSPFINIGDSPTDSVNFGGDIDSVMNFGGSVILTAKTGSLSFTSSNGSIRLIDDNGGLPISIFDYSGVDLNLRAADDIFLTFQDDLGFRLDAVTKGAYNSGLDEWEWSANTHNFRIGTTDEYTMTETEFDVHSNSIINAAQLSFSGNLFQNIQADIGGIIHNVPTGDVHKFNVNGIEIVEINATDIKFSSTLKTIEFFDNQNNVGSSGAADVVPNRPTTYIKVKAIGITYLLPAFALP